jgi:hypothetical protein
MISWILTASYLWKDTWKRWLEQPGSILARSVVTIIMVCLSVLLLVGFRMQIERLKTEVASFGLDNLLVIETITPQDISTGISSGRFRSIQRHGPLFTARKMLASANGSNGKNAAVIGYSDEDIRGLLPYLKYGHEMFVLSTTMPQGVAVDYTLSGNSFTAVALKPQDKLIQLIQGDTLFIPIDRLPEIEKRGYSLIYYLQREPDAPEITDITEAIQRVSRADGNGKIDIKSADLIKKRLEKLEGQQNSMKFWLALILGGALSLIYGVLSILEFRQSMYIAALLKSFGVSRLLLGLRSIIENILIVNTVTIGIIYTLSQYHDTVFAALRMKTGVDINTLYWGQETMWTIMAANIGVLISSIPVFLALRKQVGNILE